MIDDGIYTLIRQADLKLAAEEIIEQARGIADRSRNQVGVLIGKIESIQSERFPSVG